MVKIRLSPTNSISSLKTSQKIRLLFPEGMEKPISQNKANEELSKIFYFKSEKIGKY